ncbi:MAG: hypothetical protein LAO08_18455 [Acidobacteriia bacterium]|nr:hypothetical protein [Terriglobia bacterium]
MPDEIKAALFDAKNISDLPLTQLDRAVTAIHRLATLDKNVLNRAEAHPEVLRMLTGMAKKTEE